MPSELQALTRKVDSIAKDVNQLIGKVDTIFPNIATKEFVRGEVKKCLAEHKTNCWKDGTYQPAPRLKDGMVGTRNSLMPKTNKGVIALYSLVASMGGALVLVIKWLIGAN